MQTDCATTFYFQRLSSVITDMDIIVTTLNCVCELCVLHEEDIKIAVATQLIAINMHKV